MCVTKKRHRDHLLHACRIALLGERILRGKITYDDNKEFRLLDLVRELLRKQDDTGRLFGLYGLDKADDETLDEKILQIWYVAAIFHDVGFIFEAFTEVWENLQFLMKLPNFNEMHLDIEKALTDFKKGFEVSDVRGEYHKNKFRREFDHSKIGASLISNLIGDSNIICDAAAFIADNHSSNEILDFSKRPLSFLMVLLDEIQEWERPVLGRKLGDQILSEKISNLSPFIEYQKVEPEIDSITLYSNDLKDFSIEMQNDSLNLDFILDYSDKVSVLEKTDFSFPMMLYLKYKDLQRLIINTDSQMALKSALKDALVEVNLLFSIDGEHEEIDEYVKELNGKYFPEGLYREFGRNKIVLKKPKILVRRRNFEWGVIDDKSKYRIKKNNNNLKILEVKKYSKNSDLPFNLAVRLHFVSKGALSYKWHRQCDVLLYETLLAKNNILSNWLDDILNYRTKDSITFDIGDMPRVLTGDFTALIARSHRIYLHDENINRLVDNAEHTYEMNGKDKINVIVKFDTLLRNTNPDNINQIIFNYDEDIMDIEVKRAFEDGNSIDKKDIWQSPIPEKDYGKKDYKERFVMSIPFSKPLHYDEEKKVGYEIILTLPIETLERKDYADGFYNWRHYETKEGNIRANWDKNLFDTKYCGSLFLDNCTYDDLEIIQNKENLSKIIKAWEKRTERNKVVEDIEKQLKTKKKECICGIYSVDPIEDAAKKHYYFEKSFETLQMRHLAVFYWIPKSI